MSNDISNKYRHRIEVYLLICLFLVLITFVLWSFKLFCLLCFAISVHIIRLILKNTTSVYTCSTFPIFPFAPALADQNVFIFRLLCRFYSWLKKFQLWQLMEFFSREVINYLPSNLTVYGNNSLQRAFCFNRRKISSVLEKFEIRTLKKTSWRFLRSNIKFLELHFNVSLKTCDRHDDMIDNDILY